MDKILLLSSKDKDFGPGIQDWHADSCALLSADINRTKVGLYGSIHTDSYKIDPPQNHSGHEKFYNLVDEAENVCRFCGEYHSIQGRVLRPFSEALQTWIDIEVTINEKIAKEGRMNV